MSNTSFTDFDALFAQVLKLYSEGAYAQAIDLTTAGIARFSANTRYLRLARSMIRVRMGDHDAGLAELRDLIEGGYWLGERQWLDADYDAIRDLPEFKRLQAISRERLKAAQADARPDLFTFEPDAAEEPVPLLLALHGNSSSVFWHQDHWSPAAQAGWLVALPQSSQAGGLDSLDELAYSWDDEAVVDREMRKHLAALNAAHTLDPARIVVGGFSRGAENAIRLALTGEVAARGFIAVCPGGPYTGRPALWQPIIDAAKGRALHGIVIIGGMDHYVEGTDRMIAMLSAAGITCEREFHAEMGHDYPPDFGARLPDMLAAILDKQ